jgi:hypothetical protein
MQASCAFGLPCSWAPLQSMTTAASRRIPSRSERFGEFAGQSHRAAVCGGNPTTSPMGFGSFRRMNPGDRYTDLPRRYRPLSEFLTPSAVCSRPGLVALFRATSAPRISTFRAFPSRSAVASLDARCSLAVCGRLRFRPSCLELDRRPSRCLPVRDLPLAERRTLCWPVQPCRCVSTSSEGSTRRSGLGLPRAVWTADGCQHGAPTTARPVSRKAVWSAPR